MGQGCDKDFRSSPDHRVQERNDRIFAVPDRSPFEGDLQDVRRLSKLSMRLKTRNLKFLGWRGPTQAVKTVKRLSR